MAFTSTLSFPSPKWMTTLGFYFFYFPTVEKSMWAQIKTVLSRPNFPLCSSKTIKPSPWLLVKFAYKPCMTGSSTYWTTACFGFTWWTTYLRSNGRNITILLHQSITNITILLHQQEEKPSFRALSSVHCQMFLKVKELRGTFGHIHHRTANSQVANFLAYKQKSWV